MLLDLKTIKRLNVETESGVGLGKIVDLEIDVDSHGVVKYVVVKSKFLNSSERLLISPAQVVHVTENKMIVQDTLEPLTASGTTVKAVSLQESPAMNSDRT